MIKTILVTGANGQLGSELKALSPAYAQYNFLFADRSILEISDSAAVAAYFNTHKPHAVINCAAYTAVDKAESEQALAHLVNVTAVENLARACAEHHALLIHISTDFVFDGTKSTPYIESDTVNPSGVYARTKYDGEQAALRLNPTTIVIRTSWVYSAYGNNFVKTMLRLGAERPKINVVFDQCGTPTYAADIASAIMTILPEANETNYGLYHFSNEGVCSWYDLATEALKAKGIATPVYPIESKDFPTPVKRPSYSVLNKGKIKQTFGVPIAHWREALLRCIDKMG